MEEAPQLNLSLKEWALFGVGSFFALTAIGYVHDNYWDPSKKRTARRRTKRANRPPAEKTKLEQENPNLQGEALFTKIVKTGENLEAVKKYEEAEKYYLRLYDLAKEEAAKNPPEIYPVLMSFVLRYIAKNYRSQKKWELAEDALEEILSFGEALQDSELLEWRLALVDTLMKMKRYPEALQKGEEAKQFVASVPPESRTQVVQFMLLEKLSLLHRITGNFDQAEAEMNEALAIKSPQTANRAAGLMLDLANMYLVMGNKKKADETLEIWSNRPEIRSKNKFIKQRLIASCYYDANRLETADGLFSDIVKETEGDPGHKSDCEQSLNFLAVISHERLQPERAAEYYRRIKKHNDMYAYTTSRYFQTNTAKFVDKGKEGSSLKGTWALSLDIRPIFVKGVPAIKPGTCLTVTVETLEGVSKKEEERGKEEEEKEGEEEETPLPTKKKEIVITQEMLDSEVFEVETPEILTVKGHKTLIELELFTDSSHSQSLGLHPQLVCVLEDLTPPPFTLTPEMLRQFQAMA